MAEIRVDGLSKSFADFTAVRGSSFTIPDGDFFVLLGPSGCGKTTTLRMIAGLEMPTAGRILLDGADVTGLRASQRDIAFVFQLFALYPHMSVRRNIGFPLSCQGTPRAEIAQRVAEAARLLRIEHLLDRPVTRLSGGDRQRVALGRAIVRRPKAFLMDEPLGALDSEFRVLMCQELRALHDRLGATTVYVTHDQLEAMSLADTIAVMNAGEVEQIGPPQEVYDHPASRFVADFIGSPPMNFLVCDDGLPHGVVLAHAPPGPVVMGVRPEHVGFDDGSTLRAGVVATEYLGTTQIVTLDTSYGRIKARRPAADTVHAGESVGLGFRAGSICLFDAASGRALTRG